MPKCIIYGVMLLFIRYAYALEEYYLKCVNSSNSHTLKNASTCAIERSSYTLDLSLKNDHYSTYDMILNAAIENCNFNDVEIEVDLLYNIKNETECKISGISVKTTHSYFSVRANVSEECTKMQMTLPISYIFKGCYATRISPSFSSLNEILSVQPFTSELWINNRYDMDTFRVHPTFTTTNSKDSIDIKWIFPRHIENLQYVVKISNLSEVHLKRNSKISGCGKYSKNSIDVTNSCNQTKSEIKCTVSCLSLGTYSANLDFGSNPHCLSLDGIFANYCNWENNFERIWHPSNAPVINEVLSSSYATYIMIGVLFVVVALVFCTTVALIRSKLTTRKPVQNKGPEKITALSNLEEDKEINVGHVDGIFLLYARDCSAFMDLMQEFRKMLSELTGCKVYDLFDDEQFNKIAESPHDWVQRMVENNSIKVVLVATEIGEILHQHLIKHFSQGVNDHTIDPGYCLYRNPNFIDAYVSYAIKLISININSNAPYQKYYICRIPSVIKNMDFFQHINPFKRYDLPHALKILAENITKSSIDLAPPVKENWTQHDMERKFLNSLHDFKTFVDKHPDYVKQMILSSDS